MDGSVLAEEQIAALGTVFQEALQSAADDLRVGDLAQSEQRVQALGRAVLGRVVEAVVAGRAALLPAGVPACPTCQTEMQRVDLARRRDLQGLVGDYALCRAWWHCRSCHQGQAPVDAHLGLGPGALSPALCRVVCREGIGVSFGEGVANVEESLGITLDKHAVRRGTEALGEVAEAQMQAAIVRAQQDAPVWPAAEQRPCPDVLVVEVDGVQGRLHDGWHEVKVGRVAPLGPELHHDPQAKRTYLKMGASTYCAGLEEAELFWWRVYAEACRHGLGTRRATVVLLADGAEWIWTHGPSFLAVPGVTVVQIVDFFHATQHLWQVGAAVFGAGTPAASAWVEPLKDRLYTQGAPAVLAALATLTPASAAAVEEVRLAHGYFTTHMARMDYPAFVARQLPIGSGAVESTCKTLFAARAKGAGMRWGRRGLQAVLSLRAVERSARWTPFWRAQPQRQRRSLCPHARTHHRERPTCGCPAAPASGPARPAHARRSGRAHRAGPRRRPSCATLTQTGAQSHLAPLPHRPPPRLTPCTFLRHSL